MPVNLPMLSLNEEAQSNDEVFREIEDYFDEAEREELVQVGDPPQYVLSSHTWLGASSSGGAGPSTSGVPPATLVPSTHARIGSPSSLPRRWGKYRGNIS